MKIQYLLLALFATVASAFAADNQSETSSSHFLDKAYASYSATYHGESVKNLDAGHGVDRNGKESKTSAVNLDGTLTAAYLFAPRLGVGPYVPFLLVPTVGQNFIIGDVGLTAFNGNTIKTENLTVSTNLILQAPTSDFSKDANLRMGVKTTPWIRYSISDSPVSVGAWTEEKWYAGVTKGKEVKLWALPYVNYSLSRKLGLNLGYEMEWRHEVGQKSGKFGSYQKDMQLGVNWNITKAVMLNPYLQVFTTTNSVSWNTTGVGAFLTASLL